MRTRPSPGLASTVSSIFSPSRRRSMGSVPATTELRSTTRGCAVAPRLNANRWPVRAAARSRMQQV